MGITELALKIIFCLLLAGLLGWIIGYLLGRIWGSANATELLNECESKMRVREQELNGVRSDLTAATTRLGTMEAELVTVSTALKTRDGWVTDLESKNKALQFDLDTRTAELEDARAAATRAQADWQAQLNARQSEAEAELNALRARVTSAAAQSAQQKDGELTALRATLAAKEEELAKVVFRLKNLEPLTEQLKARDRRLAELEIVQHKMLQANEHEVATLQGELATRAAKLTALQAQLTLQPPAHDGFATEAAVRAQLSDRDAEIARLRLRISELEPLITEVQQREAAVRALNVQIKNRESVVGTLDQRVRELEPLSAQLREREGELTGLRQRLLELDAMTGLLRQRDASLRDWELRYLTLERERAAEITRLKVHITELEMMARAVQEPTVNVSPAAALPSSAQDRDDLKKIFGIGPVLETLLHSHGIYRFRQIAEWKQEDVQHYDELLADFRGRIVRDDWVSGAREEHLKKYGEQL